MHIAKLGTMALIDDKNNLLIRICVHNLSISRVLYGICHLLNGGNDKLTVLILDLFYQQISAVCGVNRACFKLVELLSGLRVKVLTVNKENNFLDVRVGCEDLCRLKGCQGFTCTGGMPNICIAVSQGSLSNQCFYCIHLIRTHNHQDFICVIDDGISRQHLNDVVACQKGN